MSQDCCAPEIENHSLKWKRILVVALILNIAMFLVEIIASKTSGSMSLKADALDFLGDSFNYGVSVYVVSHTLKTRAQVSIIKGLTMISFAVFILVETYLRLREGGLPKPPTMGIVGTAALAVNFSVAFLLYRYREGDSNMQSVWLCTRNDAIGNIMVIVAAFLVHFTHTGWPDWIASCVLASLGIHSGSRVIRLARVELSQNLQSA